ncbi:MAG: type VII toxin-antitoxin system MntA family adenylyltransferase antitoxin [Pseudohaliea sp.]
MNALRELARLASGVEAIEVLWLYGSRARGDAEPASDYDLAAALTGQPPDAARWLALEMFEREAEQALGASVSCIDINRAPVPLAANVIHEGWVLFCRSDLRLRAEEQRVWSLWEAYKGEHERNRQAL